MTPLFAALLKKCLNAEYNHTENAGDYAIQVENNTLYLLFQWSNDATDLLSQHGYINYPRKCGRSGSYCDN